MKTVTFFVVLLLSFSGIAVAQSKSLDVKGFIPDSIRKKAGLRTNSSAPDYMFIPWKCSNGWGVFGSIDCIDIPAEFDSVGQFHNGLAVIAFKGKYGLLDKTGAIILPLEYDAVQTVAQGHAAIAKAGAWGYFLKKGKITVLKYDTAGTFHHGMGRVRRSGLWGFVNATGKEVVPCRYEAVGEFSASGLCAVKSGGKWGFITKNGKNSLPAQFSFASEFSEGLAAVVAGDSVGYINARGTWVIPPEYSAGLPFSGGAAFVKYNGKWGAIDHKRGVPLWFIYDEVRQFGGGIGFARRDTAWFAVTTSGISTFLPNIENALPFRDGFAVVKFRGKWGVVDTTLRLALQPVYDTIYGVEYRRAFVRRGKEKLYVSITGNPVGNDCMCIREPQFDMTELLRRVRYPEIARRNNIEGKVEVRAFIGKDGKVKRVVIDRSDNQILERAAIDAVTQQPFTPAIERMRIPVEYQIVIPIVFKLQ